MPFDTCTNKDEALVFATSSTKKVVLGEKWLMSTRVLSKMYG